MTDVTNTVCKTKPQRYELNIRVTYVGNDLMQSFVMLFKGTLQGGRGISVIIVTDNYL